MYSTPSRKRSRSAYTPSPYAKRSKSNPTRSSVSTLTRKVNKILSEQERKNFDNTATLTLVAGTAQVIQLNSIAQGDDAVSRDGRKVSMVSSQMRYTIDGTSGLPLAFRVIVLRDMQSNGLTPVAGDILTAPTNIRSPLTMDFKERFRVIHDNFCTYGKGFYPSTTVTGEQPNAPCQYFFKFKDEDAQTEYGNIGNIPTSNSLVMLVLGGGRMEYYHRLRFTDS